MHIIVFRSPSISVLDFVDMVSAEDERRRAVGLTQSISIVEENCNGDGGPAMIWPLPTEIETYMELIIICCR